MPFLTLPMTFLEIRTTDLVFTRPVP